MQISRPTASQFSVPNYCRIKKQPLIGICNTWSELTPCNAYLRILAEQVKRCALETGGFPMEFPLMSLGGPPT